MSDSDRHECLSYQTGHQEDSHMKLQQLSLFLENRPGQVKVPCKILAEAGINILALSLADTEQFGILRLIVKDWQKGKQALEKAGCIVTLTDVLAVDVPDKPGGLADALDIIDKAGLGVEYMYAFTSGTRGKNAALIFRFEDPDAAIKAVEARGLKVLSSEELLARVGA
jgi:hypothetical protein